MDHFETSRSDRCGRSVLVARHPSVSNQEGETLQIVTKDLIRNLKVPCKDPSGESLILPAATFEQITSKSWGLTKEDRDALKAAYQKKKDEEIIAAEERKRQIYETDLARKQNPALNELEMEARGRAQHLLERADTLKMEQEEDIKKLNKLILGAQCQATRDHQIKEKKQMQAELTEEEKRLDDMMEVERRRALEIVNQIDELRKEQRIKGKQQICGQIEHRLLEKDLQDNMKEQEKCQVRENQEKMNQEDLKALEKKKEELHRLQQEIMCINNQTLRAKEQRREEEKLADMRDMEYIKNKLQREAELEAQQKQIKKDKELEIARLRARQEKATGYKADQEELRVQRSKEIIDREWRRKQKELAVKKAEEDENLKTARVEQLRCKEHFLSIKADREKADYERVLKAHQEAIIKQKEEEEKMHQKSLRHSEVIRQQVKEHEVRAVAQRRELLKETDQMSEAVQQRQMRLNELKEKKLKELKATGLPDKYCSDVERKARAF
ncbi:cilia- and flagella-associated protein 45-like [Scomber scombrus]|uniref:cilia- and flagella-associated protein 45-like n=1 Tax=Scomber scombrus TaxID=13677 RepID=UPI002DDA371A|nr:cilia- and flagella-associated protein 45-like [Scomber scombrus]